MTEMESGRFGRLIQGGEWVKGAVNYDEDLHFSTLYLRASHARDTAPLYPGYTSIFAFFTGFKETYYLLKSECLFTATAVVDRAIREPTWLPEVLATIRRRSDALAGVFGPETTPDRLASLPGPEILALYERHAEGQRRLYKYARLPEALDRGIDYFSNYLRGYLLRLGIAPSGCESTFAVLSQPEVPSVLALEMLEFEEIVRGARADLAAVPGGAQGRARMFLGPDLLRRLRAHREKWKYLPYHGYGRRELATLGQYVERLIEHMDDPGSHDRAAAMQRRAGRAGQERREMLETLRMDDAHRALFEVYPEIGAVKLHRRYAQLRNFFYLDMLLAEIADRIDVSEWTLRCMLPEEVVAALKAGGVADASILDRGEGCMYALLPDRECIVTGAEAERLRESFQAMTRSRNVGNVLQGTVACRGKVTGRCKVIIRADDAREDFARGTIVVSESTDPDLVGFLKDAGGVLTEQGGVTSHAALICRELGIPTIIGIEGLLDRVRDGDVVEVDAERGLVTLAPRQSTPTPEMAFSPREAHSPELIGPKAYNLGVVRSLGYAVPDYVTVSYDGVRRLMEQPSNGATKRLVNWTLEQLNLPDGVEVALRSSAANEDRDEGSNAGAYRSLLHVGRDRLPEAFREFVASNGGGGNGNGRAYRGSIIVQRMVEAEYAGVCLTSDGRTGHGDSVIIELMAGSNEAVTQGTARPDRVVVDRLTGDILENLRRSDGSAAPVIDLTDLVRQFLTLEAHFGKPMDIEWAVADRKLYILQARPIVMKDEVD